MKKSLWGLLAALGLVALIFWVKQYREEAPRRSGFVFDTTRAAEMTGLRVRYLRDSMQLRQARRLDRDAWVTEDGYPVDTARLRTVQGWLLRLQTRETVADAADAQGLWDYGLNPENAKAVEWTWASGDTVRILLGKTSSLDYGFTYWKWRDRPEVYRTPGNFIWEVSSRAADWKQRLLWPPFTAADVRAVRVEWRDSGAVRRYRVERAGAAADSFRLTEPFAAAASRAAAGKLFEQAPQFAADDFGLEMDPKRDSVPLAEPVITVSIILETGTTYTLKAGRSFGVYRYTRHPRLPHLVWVFKWRYDYFRKLPEELL